MGFKCEYKLNTNYNVNLVEEDDKLQEYRKKAEACGFNCLRETRNLYIFSSDKQFCLGIINKILHKNNEYGLTTDPYFLY